MRIIFRTFAAYSILLLFVTAAAAGQNASDLKSQKLQMHLADGITVFSETPLPAETDVQHIILAGPQIFPEAGPVTSTDVLLIFIKGDGKLHHAGATYDIQSESIALPVNPQKMEIEVASDDTLHYIKILKKMSEQDVADMQDFGPRNQNPIYFKKFDDCRAYTEKIKSPNTVSRTVLPKDYVPRVAMGTVQTIGPDAVGAHAHPMLDQLFLGLAGNDVVVHADDQQTHFGEFVLLHIPLGSSHWVTVEKGKRMYYQWMDFFMDTKGQEWLKTHKHVKENK